MRRTLALLLLLAASGEAGGGPETTLLVVNAASPASKRIANEWATWRDIPASHVLYLDRIPHLRVIPLSVFLERIWTPILDYMKEEGLEGRINLIAYSADFPYGVDFKERQRDGNRTVGSLTGLTYLIRQVKEGGLDFLSPQSNRYFRKARPRARADRRRANATEQGHLMEGQRALQRKDYQAAAAAFKKMLATYDVHPDIWFQYARCMGQLGKTKAALDALEECLELQFEQINLLAQVPEFRKLRGNTRFKALVKRLNEGTAAMQPAVGFSSERSWVGGDDAHRYYLSAMLAYTGEWGNSTPEVLSYLGAAATSDGTNPDGTVYLLVNSNIRARTRQPFFAGTAAALKKRGRKVEILEQKKDGQSGVVPNGKSDVMGAVLGTAGYSWKGSKSKILPGAICENLTSFGAVFKNGSQTKLSELLRAGAAGSSGTVTEPFALWWKFPHPYIHVHYADGASLAEAFYQSVSGPYQLLVVGDPLAQPFAKIPKIQAIAPPTGGAWRGTVKLGARVDAAKVGQWELWVDGRFAGGKKPGEQIEFDTTSLPDGPHEFRFVAVGKDAVASRGRAKLMPVTSNHGERMQTKACSEVLFDGEYVVEGSARGAETVELRQGSRRVASASPEKGAFRLAVPASILGRGPVSLTVRAKAQGKVLAVGRHRVVVRPANLLPPSEMSGPVLPGLAGTTTLEDGSTERVALTMFGDDAGRSVQRFLRGKKVTRLVLEGEFEVPVSGEHRLILQTGGALELNVAGRELFLGKDLSDQVQVPLFLEAGWYPIRLVLEPKGAVQLFALLGGERVTRPLRTHVSAGRELKKKPSPAKGQESLFDGKHAGEAVAITPERGETVSFKTTALGIARVVLFPEPSKVGVMPWPEAWTVEWFDAGKWKPVEDLVLVIARSAKRPPSDKKKKIAAVEIPDYVSFTFKPVDTKKIRLRPAGGTARLVEVGIYQAEKKRR